MVALRRRTWLLVSDGDNSTGKLTLTKWTAGLDAPVLARAINAAIERQVGGVNCLPARRTEAYVPETLVLASPLARA